MHIYQPVIIIGAARSGTNMLRDVLTQLPGIGTWPCDEINYIWRHRNVREPTDEFGPELATPDVQSFIRQKFDQLARKRSLSHLVEKTCANALRVEFVNRIFPNAQFIHIIRDGRDVAASAQKRWTAPLDLVYIARKARYVPFTDVPYYASRYLANRAYRLLSRDHRLSTWGPRFVGLDQALQRSSLLEVCALQWQRSVTKAEQAFKKIEPHRLHCVQYEAFVTKPDVELQRLSTFLNLPLSVEQAKRLVQNVSTDRLGQWHTEWHPDTIKTIETLLHETLESHDYHVVSQ